MLVVNRLYASSGSFSGSCREAAETLSADRRRAVQRLQFSYHQLTENNSYQLPDTFLMMLLLLLFLFLLGCLAVATDCNLLCVCVVIPMRVIVK